MIKDTNTSIRNHLFSFVTFICLITQIIGFQDTVPKQLVRPTARALNVDDEKNLASLREISNFAHNNLLNILKL